MKNSFYFHYSGLDYRCFRIKGKRTNSIGMPQVIFICGPFMCIKYSLICGQEKKSEQINSVPFFQIFVYFSYTWQ